MISNFSTRLKLVGSHRPGRALQSAMVVVLALSCSTPDAGTLLAPVVNPLDAAIVLITPQAVTLASGGSNQFTATATLPDGHVIVPEVDWLTTGGTISATGLFTASVTPGTYRVSAQLRGHTRSGSAPVTVAAPTLISVSLTPATVALAAGATRQFSATGTLSDGSTTVPAVTYSVTGGTITASGLYTAGTTAGTFHVIATPQGGIKADTSIVNIAVPAAVLLQMVMSPAALALLPGGTGQFTVTGTWSDGSTSVPAVTYVATGGTITAGGLYTAGSTSGTFRVIAAQQGGAKADTSAVTITAPPPTMTQMVMSPASLALAPGGTGQFTVTGLWSDGSTSAPAVTYSATGGTITAGGLYTAGVTPGTFSVISSQQGGAKADTSAVVIAAPPASIQWVFSTGFETGQPMDASITYPGGSATLSTAQAHAGSYSLNLTTPSQLYTRAAVRQGFPFSATLHRAELWFYLPAGHPDMRFEVALEGWTGSQQHLSSFSWLRDTQYGLLGWQKWIACAACGGMGGAWDSIPGAQGIDMAAGQWHNLQVAVDYARMQYVQLVIDGRTIDMTGQPYEVSAMTTSSSSFQVSILLWAQTALPVTAFVDDVRIGTSP